MSTLVPSTQSQEISAVTNKLISTIVVIVDGDTFHTIRLLHAHLPGADLGNKLKGSYVQASHSNISSKNFKTFLGKILGQFGTCLVLN